MNRIEVHQFGPSAKVARVTRVSQTPMASLKAGQVRVAMHFAPVNPADLNFMEGTYGIVPDLPAAVGNEGAGVVSEVGPGVTILKPGDAVLPLEGGGLWSQSVVLPETGLLKLPAGLPLQQAAMLRINPATAAILLEEFVDLRPGDWVVQNAANSAVGMAADKLCQLRGCQMLNLVRSEESATLCRANGALHVVCESDPNVAILAKEILNGARPQLALNAVGGESATRLAGLLADRAVHVTFGAMSRQKISLPNRFLIFQELTFTGFWLTRWIQRQTSDRVRALYQDLATKMAAGQLSLPVAAVYPMDDITNALTHATQGGRGGKILLDLRSH